MKRFFDLTLVIVALPLWGSVVLIFYIVNVLLEGRPGFYSSNRHVGIEKIISIKKFRVMKKNIDKTLNRTSIPTVSQTFLNLPRDRNIYTNFGLIIEKFGVTELPQFFSVIKGDMSIVGSRPLPNDIHNLLKAKFPSIALKRYDSKCGMTGLPQLIGREFISDEERLNLEASYSTWSNTNYNFIVDLKIIIYTILFVLGLKKRTSIDEALSLLR